MSDVVAAPVLILASQRDFAADRVIRCLQDLDVPVERWNAEDERVVAWRPEQAQLDPPPRAVWLRQYLPEHTIMGTVRGVDDFLVAREQWRTWLSDLAEDPAPRARHGLHHAWPRTSRRHRPGRSVERRRRGMNNPATPW